MTDSIKTFAHLHPRIDSSAFIDPSSLIIGDVEIGADSSVWPFTVIRGDMHSIRIGKRCSIQDGSVLHITHASHYNPQGYPLHIGDDCTIGHKVCLHGCHLKNRILVGIGSIIMDGVTVHDDVIIGANSFVPPNKTLQSGYLYIGSPAQARRELTHEEREMLRYMALNYVKLKNQYLTEPQN